MSVDVKYVIFDMDGLLLDTEPRYTRAMTNICQEYGRQFTWDVKVKAMGRTARGSAEVVIRECQLPMTVDEYLNRIEEEYLNVFNDVPLMPGVDRLVSHLTKHKIPIAVATSSKRSTFGLKTRHHAQFFARFHHILVASDDPEVKRGKPAPDSFLVCASRFQTPPSSMNQVLVFEDSPAGVEAAHAAKMQVVMVPDERVDVSDLKGKATILKSLVDFEPQQFGLAPFD